MSDVRQPGLVRNPRSVDPVRHERRGSPSLGGVTASTGAGEQPAKSRVPAVDGLFTVDDPPHLIGGRIPGSDTWVFPLGLGGADPARPGVAPERVLLSRTGRIWSYTDSRYTPPPPYVVTTEPFEPITIAAVELEAERMVVLGQVASGFTVDDLAVDLPVELVLEPLYEDEEHQYLTWKWKPIENATT